MIFSLVFKQESPYSQWFYAGLKPNVHFIPVNRRLSDLLNKIQYAINNDAECIQIAMQAREFAELLWDAEAHQPRPSSSWRPLTSFCRPS